MLDDSVGFTILNKEDYCLTLLASQLEHGDKSHAKG